MKVTDGVLSQGERTVTDGCVCDSLCNDQVDMEMEWCGADGADRAESSH
jgi:hypothetical protein